MQKLYKLQSKKIKYKLLFFPSNLEIFFYRLIKTKTKPGNQKVQLTCLWSLN